MNKSDGCWIESLLLGNFVYYKKYNNVNSLEDITDLGKKGYIIVTSTFVLLVTLMINFYEVTSLK